MKSPVAILAFVIVLTGCSNDTSSQALSDEQTADQQAKKEQIFDESVSEMKCSLLDIEDVAAVTGEPAASIEEALGGCFYSWEGHEGSPEGTFYLSSLRVHDTIERAQRTYARNTEDVTAEQMDQAKEQVKEDLEAKNEEGRISDSEESAASALTDLAPEVDFKHRVLEGVGDEAAMDNRGSAYIRVGNVTITFSGKTGDEDYIDPERAAEAGKRMVKNLGEL